MEEATAVGSAVPSGAASCLSSPGFSRRHCPHRHKAAAAPPGITSESQEGSRGRGRRDERRAALPHYQGNARCRRKLHRGGGAPLLGSRLREPVGGHPCPEGGLGTKRLGRGSRRPVLRAAVVSSCDQPLVITDTVVPSGSSSQSKGFISQTAEFLLRIFLVLHKRYLVLVLFFVFCLV